MAGIHVRHGRLRREDRAIYFCLSFIIIHCRLQDGRGYVDHWRHNGSVCLDSMMVSWAGVLMEPDSHWYSNPVLRNRA